MEPSPICYGQNSTKHNCTLWLILLPIAFFPIEGKATFKEEFVTAGGVSLKEIDFKSFRSKLFPTLYIGGEALDIDAVTGGYNFQNAWSSGYLIAEGVKSE